MTSRRLAREEALQLLYANEITGSALEAILEEPAIIHDNEAPFSDFTRELVLTAAKSAEESDAIIESHARNWSFERIAILDRLILRLAIAEFLHFDDIPPKVTIDEAIELGKKYSTGKSGRFINGMLDSVLNDLTRQRKILKTNDTKSDNRKKKKT